MVWSYARSWMVVRRGRVFVVFRLSNVLESFYPVDRGSCFQTAWRVRNGGGSCMPSGRRNRASSYSVYGYRFVEQRVMLYTRMLVCYKSVFRFWPDLLTNVGMIW